MGVGDEDTAGCRHLSRGSGSQAAVEGAVLKRLGPRDGGMFKGTGEGAGCGPRRSVCSARQFLRIWGRVRERGHRVKFVEPRALAPTPQPALAPN